MSADSITLGEVEITRVVELHGPVSTARSIVPGVDPALWQENRSWLAPDFWRPEDDAYLAAVQTWVLRSQGRTILVDTGVGNDRDRPQIPQFAHLRTTFLDRLAEAGVRPEDVDVVVNTHVHYDHVGWNTRLQDGAWVPTFPNAAYLIPRADNLYFDPQGPGRGRPPRDENERRRWQGSELVFNDSVAPVHRAGQAVLWEDTYRVDRDLVLRAAPGHTPGSSVLHLASGTDRAVFVGDIVHSPVQILRPDCNSCFCDDPARAAATRRRVLGQAADTNALVVPAHFPGHGAAEVRRAGGDFALSGWAPLPRT
ncbi:MBL fold metallo-hydrolase [Streptomyces sp. 8L]|uniref:MBL fold metallo-hydrolase n=1 Tax=Streptomyces sp. 8L TaxID=2877242 RepID=UPI001CD3C398|nr:MBL fold metallo-hydrolase [Streptomyces sp. 8L]MCA1217077.1 MBL fold metallo-hydrolase [Streptomyces sp. 8L]